MAYEWAIIMNLLNVKEDFSKFSLVKTIDRKPEVSRIAPVLLILLPGEATCMYREKSDRRETIAIRKTPSCARAKPQDCGGRCRGRRCRRRRWWKNWMAAEECSYMIRKGKGRREEWVTPTPSTQYFPVTLQVCGCGAEATPAVRNQTASDPKAQSSSAGWDGLTRKGERAARCTLFSDGVRVRKRWVRPCCGRRARKVSPGMELMPHLRPRPVGLFACKEAPRSASLFLAVEPDRLR